MGLLLMTHSLVRWLVVIALVVTVVICLSVWLRKQQTTMDRTSMSVFIGLLDLQVLLGIIFLVWSGLAGAGFPMYRVEHGTTMLIAAGLAHLSARWKRSESPVRARNSLFIALGVLALVFAGISVLPQGW